MNPHFRLYVSSRLAAALAVFAAATPGFAQQLEEVVVTSRKIEERLQDVPLSIAAFSSADIESSGARDLYDLTRFTPGFTFEKLNRYGAQGGLSRPVIRGMSNILGEGNASVFVDGVVYSDSILAFPMDVVERVEVIKGPQAALFGRATFSGAINFITKKGGNTPENKMSLRAADYGDYEVNLLSRGVLQDDRLFYMVHGRYYSFDGMYRNSLDGRKVGGEESQNFNASLEFRPGEVFSAIVSAGYSKDDDDLAAIVLQDRYANNCFLSSARQYYCGEVAEQGAVTLDRAGLQGTEGVNRESTRVSAALKWNLGAYTLSSNSGLFGTDSEYGYDSTYQAATALALTTVPMAPGAVRPTTDVVRRQSTLRNEVSERDEWSTELRLDSPANFTLFAVAAVFVEANASETTTDRPDARAVSHAFSHPGCERVCSVKTKPAADVSKVCAAMTGNPAIPRRQWRLRSLPGALLAGFQPRSPRGLRPAIILASSKWRGSSCRHAAMSRLPRGSRWSAPKLKSMASRAPPRTVSRACSR